jgi:hypothetical protein
MASCKVVNILYRALPLQPVRDLLIRTHMEKCECCQARLVSRREAEALLVKPGDAGPAEALWEMIERRAVQAVRVPEKKAAWLSWEWAAGAAALLLVAAASFWLLRGVETGAVRADLTRPPERFEIDYINVGGAPAQAFVYQPRGSEMVFVWAGKNL